MNSRFKAENGWKFENVGTKFENAGTKFENAGKNLKKVVRKFWRWNGNFFWKTWDFDGKIRIFS